LIDEEEDVIDASEAGWREVEVGEERSMKRSKAVGWVR